MITFDPSSPEVTDALRQWRGRSPFPTEFSSAEMRSFSRELRERSVFSARTTNARYVQRIADVVDEMLSGEINLATGRMQLMRELAVLGYDPRAGFPQDFADVPPAEEGSLRDLSSELRIDLVLETNQRMAANYGRLIAGHSAYGFYAYPAWELVRIYVRSVERGSPDSHSAGWERRWHDASQSVSWEGVSRRGAEARRFVALKDSPIWEALGDGEGGYEDTLGNPYPPFAFNSGMGWCEVSRAECRDLGLDVTGEKKDSAKVAEVMREVPFSPGAEEVQEAFQRLSPDLQEALRKELEEAA